MLQPGKRAVFRDTLVKRLSPVYTSASALLQAVTVIWVLTFLVQSVTLTGYKLTLSRLWSPGSFCAIATVCVRACVPACLPAPTTLPNCLYQCVMEKPGQQSYCAWVGDRAPAGHAHRVLRGLSHCACLGLECLQGRHAEQHVDSALWDIFLVLCVLKRRTGHMRYRGQAW